MKENLSEIVRQIQKKDIPIAGLELSARAYNALKMNGIRSLSEFVSMDLEALKRLELVSTRVAEELYFCAREHLYLYRKALWEAKSEEAPVNREADSPEGTKEIPVSRQEDCRPEPDSKGETITEIGKADAALDAFAEDDRPIEVLGLSVRAFNCLKREHIDTLCELSRLSADQLGKINNMGRKTVAEIQEKLKKYHTHRAMEETVSEADDDVNPEETKAEAQPVFFPDDRRVERQNFSVRSINCLKRAGIFTVQQLLDTTPEQLLAIKNLGHKSLSELEQFKKNYVPLSRNLTKTEISAEDLKPRIMRAFTEPFKELSFQEINAVMPESAEDQIIKQAVGELLADREIEYVDFRCYKIYPSFYAALESYLPVIPDRVRVVMQRRYSGETLDAIAQDLGITRERVRQFQVKYERKLRAWFSQTHGDSVFDEDFYKALYTKYDLPDAFWSETLELPQASIRYLKISCRRGKGSPDEALGDETIPISLRYRLRSFLDKDKIRIDGILVPRKRADVEEYALRKFAQDEISFEHFAELYNGLLESNNIPFDEQLYYTEGNKRTRANRFGDTMTCLWKQRERLRYYDVQARDYTELLEALNLESYQNTEISTRKFMELYPALMERYDIRDPYELHNLLRKIAEQYGLNRVQFSRQPMLQFGEFDRDKAIEDAMIMLSPVTQADLVEYLFKEYGYERSTTLINYLKPLGRYYHNGVYSIDFRRIPDERVELLRQSLTEDFYYFEEIKRIYSSLFPEANTEDINPRSLKAMGFLVNSNYVVQNYSSAEAFFTELLTREAVYDVRAYKRRYGTIQMFYQTYTELLKKHQIFRFEPDQIITMSRLETLHITAEQIEDYCSSVQEYMEDDVYFTIESLRQDGFSHPLDALGFEDYFYGSLLGTDERFSSQTVFGNVVLLNGKCFGRFSVSDFLCAQLRDYDSVDLDEFIQDVHSRFGVVIPNRHEVTAAIRGTELYYDSIMDKVYRNKSFYYADFDE